MIKIILFEINFLLLLCVFFALPCLGKQNFPKSDDERAIRAKEIVKAYRQATGIDKFIGKIAYLDAEFSYSWSTSKVEASSMDKLKFGSPNQLGFETTNSPNSLGYHYVGVWDGQTYYEKGQGKDGRNQINKKFKLKQSELTDNPDLTALKRRTFNLFFPITFENTLYSLELKYIGVAKSPDGTTVEVIEAMEPDIKNLFLFDRNSHLLLQWIVTKANDKIIRQYSDYRKNGDILIAQKIVSNSQSNNQTSTTIEIKKFTLSSSLRSEEFIIPEK